MDPLFPAWLEFVLSLMPLLFVLGYFGVEKKIAYGLAGLTGSGFFIFFGYIVLGQEMWVPASVHLLSWVIIGLIISLIGEFQGIRKLDASGVAAASTTAVAPGGTSGSSGVKREPVCIIHGIVHESSDKSKRIKDAEVSIPERGLKTKTDGAGKYSFEIHNIRSFPLEAVFVIVDHPSYHYPCHSKRLKLRANTDFEINFPMDVIIGPKVALGNVRATFSDSHGNPAPNKVKRGGDWSAHIETYSPLTFDQPSKRPIPKGGEDHFELWDQGTKRLIMDLTHKTAPSKGRIRYMSPTHVFVTGKVPLTYADKTPLPLKNITVQLKCHVNVS